MDEILWAMDICTEVDHPFYGNPILAHQIVQDGGDYRMTACGKRLTQSNHPKGWWSTKPNRLPLPPNNIHCRERK